MPSSDLYTAHLRDVYSYAYYRVGNHHDAEDLTEQTFLQAYRHFERARRESNGRPLRPWLIRIAHNLASNSPRPLAPAADAARHAEPDPAPHDTEAARRGPRRAPARSSMASRAPRRPPRGADHALCARHANREIARALGRTDGATKVLIHRAIKQLEEKMVYLVGSRKG